MFNNFITHSWTFHLDETFSYTIIKELFPEMNLVRTRDQNIINEALKNDNVIIADLWKDLNFEKYNLDHHFSDRKLETISKKGEDMLFSLQIFELLINNILNKTSLDIKLLTIIKDKNFSLKIIKNIVKKYLSKNWTMLLNIVNDNKAIEDYVNFYLEQEIINLIAYIEDSILTNTWYDISNILLSKIDKLIYFAKYELYELLDYRKYSSAWLVFNIFWKDYIKLILKNNNLSINNDIINFIYNNLDNNFVSYIDKIDNWIIEKSKLDWIIWIENIIKVYNQENIFSEDQNLAFYDVFLILRDIISKMILKYYIQAKNQLIINNIINDNLNNDEEYIIIDDYIPWIEKEIGENLKNKFYIIYKSSDPKSPWYYIKSLNNWQQKLLSNEILKNKEDIQWLKFIHTWRFIALFDNLENLLNTFNLYQK